MKFVLFERSTIFVALSLILLCAMTFFIHAVFVILVAAICIVLWYYYNCINNVELLLYPIILGVFLEYILALVESESFPVSLFQILFVLGFLHFALTRLIKKDFRLSFNEYGIPILIFLSIISISLIYSEGREGGILNLFRFIALLVFVWFIPNIIKTRKAILYGVLLATFVCVILSVYSLFQNIFNTEVAIQNFIGAGQKIERSSAGGIYLDPNRFAASLLLPLAFVFSLMNSRVDFKYRVLGGVAFIILLGGVFSTYSRSGFFAAFLTCVIIIKYFKQVKPFFLLSIITMGIIFIIPNLRLNFFSYSERILDLLTGNIDTSNSIRVMLGIAAIQMFLDTYTFGVGFDAFGENFTQYFNLHQAVGVREPHNIIYTIMAELGIVGLLVFVVLVFFLIRDAYSNIAKSKDVTDKIISVTLFSSFMGYLLFYQFYGGALFDTALMLNIGLFFSHKKLLS